MEMLARVHGQWPNVNLIIGVKPSYQCNELFRVHDFSSAYIETRIRLNRRIILTVMVS